MKAKILTADDLQRMAEDGAKIRGHNPDNVPLGSLRVDFMRLIGEVWRLRAKVRFQAQRIKDLETLPTPLAPIAESSTDIVLRPATADDLATFGREAPHG